MPCATYSWSGWPQGGGCRPRHNHYGTIIPSSSSSFSSFSSSRTTDLSQHTFSASTRSLDHPHDTMKPGDVVTCSSTTVLGTAAISFRKQSWSRIAERLKIRKTRLLRKAKRYESVLPMPSAPRRRTVQLSEHVARQRAEQGSCDSLASEVQRRMALP